MLTIDSSVAGLALLSIGVLLIGTCLLIAVAFLRRWQKLCYVRYVHALRRQFRPALAKVLSGTHDFRGLEVLRTLPLADLELLTDPLFTSRKLSDFQLSLLRDFCEQTGLVGLWQGRLSTVKLSLAGRAFDVCPTEHLLRAKSIRNLGKLRHQPSWELLVKALDDADPDIRLVALRSLATVAAPESFPALRERLHAAAQGKAGSLAWRAITSAMVSFDMACASALLPSLRHSSRQIRLLATEILRSMVYRVAARQPALTLTAEQLTEPLVETLLTSLVTDASANIRAGAGEITAFVADPRALPVLRDLLRDDQWVVRQRTVAALSRSPQTAEALSVEIRRRLGDPHRQVRESAIQTLVLLGVAGRHELFMDFLTWSEKATATPVVELIEQTGLMSGLAAEHSGTPGIDALVVEYLANNTAPIGLSAVLHSLSPEVRRKFMERFLSAQPGAPLVARMQAQPEDAANRQEAVEAPTPQAA